MSQNANLRAGLLRLSRFTHSQMLGTLIHEIIHVLTGDTDAQMAKILGVSITSQDTSAISKAIGSQCFQ